MPSVSVNGQPVAYREQGEGCSSVLLLHAAGGASASFGELMHLMGAEGLRVVALDLPGHGASPPFERPPLPEDLLLCARDVVVGFAEALGLGRFVLVGHSMGGAVAQLVALAHPDRLQGLVLLATGARLKVSPALLNTIRHHFERLPRLMAALGYASVTPRAQAEGWAALQLQAPQEVVLADFLACAAHDLRERLAELRCKTLVLSAEDDLLAPPKLQQQLVQLIPRAELRSIPQAGHFLCYERPDAVAAAIRDAVIDRGHPRV